MNATALQTASRSSLLASCLHRCSEEGECCSTMFRCTLPSSPPSLSLKSAPNVFAVLDPVDGSLVIAVSGLDRPVPDPVDNSIFIAVNISE